MFSWIITLNDDKTETVMCDMCQLSTDGSLVCSNRDGNIVMIYNARCWVKSAKSSIQTN
jgi:hypothetical protein